MVIIYTKFFVALINFETQTEIQSTNWSRDVGQIVYEYCQMATVFKCSSYRIISNKIQDLQQLQTQTEIRENVNLVI